MVMIICIEEYTIRIPFRLSLIISPLRKEGEGGLNQVYLRT